MIWRSLNYQEWILIQTDEWLCFVPSSFINLGFCIKKMHFQACWRKTKATRLKIIFFHIWKRYFSVLYFLCIFISMPLLPCKDFTWSTEILNCNLCQKRQIKSLNSKQACCFCLQCKNETTFTKKCITVRLQLRIIFLVTEYYKSIIVCLGQKNTGKKCKLPKPKTTSSRCLVRSD